MLIAAAWYDHMYMQHNLGYKVLLTSGLYTCPCNTTSQPQNYMHTCITDIENANFFMYRSLAKERPLTKKAPNPLLLAQIPVQG